MQTKRWDEILVAKYKMTGRLQTLTGQKRLLYSKNPEPNCREQAAAIRRLSC